MKRIAFYIITVICLLTLGWLVFFHAQEKEDDIPKVVHLDLPQIKEKGQLTALTLSGSVSYFIYKGEEMGYEYELIKNFAE